MSELALASCAAFWLGVLTSISPCLLATNVAAITFIARRVDKPKYALISGACYIAGQALAYVLLGMVLVGSLLSVPLVSHWLQKYMTRLLGPILILAGMFLLELLEFRFGGGRLKQWVGGRAETGGFWVAALLGVVFAMSFCPTTAALYFGSLIPLAITHESSVLLPALFAVGEALPVMAFALLIALAANQVGRVFSRVGQMELWARRMTGGIFITLGFYFTLAFTIDVI